MQLTKVARSPGLLITVIALLGLGSGEVSAQAARTVYAPMIFKTEAGTLQTTACLQLIERVYPSSAWWEIAGGSLSGPDRAFKEVIAAIKNKDRASLLKLTDADQARDTVRFDKQAHAFFGQFDSIRLIEVPRAYEFDGLVVFFGKFQFHDQTAFVPLTFAHVGGDVFAFLPARTDRVTFRLVNEWFAPSRPSQGEVRPYCTDTEVGRATHRVFLGSSSWQPSALLLTGAPIDMPGPLAALAKQVMSTIGQMQAALKRPTPEEFFQYLTPDGGRRLQEWFASAAQAERDKYRDAFLEPAPFYVFDQAPLIVVYAKAPAGGIRVMYFTFDEGKRLLWTNSSHITTADRVFKDGPLFSAASSGTRFSGLVIK